MSLFSESPTSPGSPEQYIVLPESLLETDQSPQTPARPTVRRLFSPHSSPFHSPIQAQTSLDISPTSSSSAVWNAGEKLRVLMDALTKSEKDILCSTKVVFCLFYSNPQTQRGPMLNLNYELYNILGDNEMDQHKFLLTPVTTIKNFSERLEEYKPPVICFTGHADDNGLAFHNDSGTGMDYITMEEFISIIVNIYKGEEKPKFLLMFACKTLSIVDVINSSEKYKQVFEDTIIVGWKTYVENMAASKVSLYILKKIYDYTMSDTNIKDKKIFVDELLSIPNLEWGDPVKQLQKTDEHNCMYNAILHYNLILYKVKTLAQLRKYIDLTILNYGRTISEYSVEDGMVYEKNTEDMSSITVKDTHIKCGKYLIVKDSSEFVAPEGYESVSKIIGSGKDGFCAHCKPRFIGVPFCSLGGKYVKFKEP